MPAVPDITIVEISAPITIADFQNLPDLPFDIHVRTSGFLAQFDRLSIDATPSGGTVFRCDSLGAEPIAPVSDAVFSRVRSGILRRFDAPSDTTEPDMLDFQTSEGPEETLCQFCRLIEETIIAALAEGDA